MISLSIITTTFNAAATLRHCLCCLEEQTVQFQHVVVDGGSTDATVEIINEYVNTVNGVQIPEVKVVSEQDNGLYHALNKGIQMATGDVIGILHADDVFTDERVLARVVQVFEDHEVEACYGDLLYVSGDEVSQTQNINQKIQSRIVRYWKSGRYDPRKFYWGWMPPHPTFFVRKSVYEKYGLFNLELGTAADYELMLRFLLKHKISCQYIPEVLTCMRVGGVSNASIGNRLKANRMDRKSWEINGLKPYPWTIALKPIRKIPQYFWGCHR